MNVIRGIRGATTVQENTAQCILSNTQELLRTMVEANAIAPRSISSIIFTMTSDLNATFPAEAARQLGWKHVPVICMRELDVPGSLTQAIRVLLQAETDQEPDAVHHVYLRGAEVLRPDLADPGVLHG